MSRRYPNRRERLLRRFYEPLVLLHTLGSTRGVHTNRLPVSPSDNSLVKDCRRSFLNELAYVCDYEKGGDTVTAIGLESTPQGCTFWVASNTSPTAKIIPFLKLLLQTLERIANSTAPGQGDKEDIAKLCISFGSRRIKKYRSLFSRELAGCRKFIAANKEALGGLELWLQRFCNFDPNDLVYLCNLAFENRKSPDMRHLKELCDEPPYKASKDAIHNKFGRLRHYIGRLAHHIRAANSLVSTASKLRHLLNGFSIRAITTPARAEWLPPIDEAAVRGKTLLDKVLVRMLPAKSPQLGFYQQELRKMDEATQTQPFAHEFTQRYKCWSISTKKHLNSKTQIDILHVANRLVTAASYTSGTIQIYLNWRPPDVSLKSDAGAANGEEENESQILQRNILNAMIREIRKDALHQIAGKQKPFNWHPDSHTGITPTVAINGQSTVVGSEWGEEIGGYDGGLSIEDNGSCASVTSLITTQKIPESLIEDDCAWDRVEEGLGIRQLPTPTYTHNITGTIENTPQLIRRASYSTTIGHCSLGSISSPLGSFLESSNSNDEEDFDDDGGVRLYD
ncbi:predicted protein [Histoplasma mississippiense (nom. inval.)]|uniref:predicted protein n=1 Tax=Ajellomyces capsulatus (strain NAm1 / WU24) TaxID=2059318 RepID=UPI000157BD24|nr:predicted protein [Histoplasma mississippiense (nom. inval.)]EDN05919.1 predicted protein [Histoplasma mississippiense (nom. inval.)]